MRKITSFILFFSLSSFLYSQSDSIRKDALNVYIEASDYVKERITFINYVRDIKVADLVVISTSEHTGSGGHKYTMFLEGQGKYDEMMDTLVYYTMPDATYDQRREKMVETLKLGLVRYVLKTPLAKYLDLDFTAPITAEVSTDKWKNWVFRTELAGFSNGRSTDQSLDLYGELSIEKITDDWKIEMEANYNFGRDRFEIDDTTIESNSTNKNVEALVVRSINDHWSIGSYGEVISSTYHNYDLKLYVAPAVEYDIFPYSESTRRQLRLIYTLGFQHHNYTDTTIYNKMKESLLTHSFISVFEMVQKWGNIEMSVSWSNFLRDFSENELAIGGFVDWRILKGLSLSMGGRYAFIHNQLSIVKGDISAEQILLRRTEQQTNYNYFLHFGFSYTFGSIYNNVVNPRFDL